MTEWGQGVLFPEANKVELKRTKFLLMKYRSMTMLMDDYEKHTEDMQQVAIDGEVARRIDQEDLHADKTANAVVLAEKQKWAYEQYKFYTTTIDRAYGLICDDEAQRAMRYRYILGYSAKETLLFFQSTMSDSTIKRKIKESEVAVANMLKLWGFFEKDSLKF